MKFDGIRVEDTIFSFRFPHVVLFVSASPTGASVRFAKKLRMVCYRVMAFPRIGSTVAHKSEASYLRPSYVRFYGERGWNM